jgi:glycerol-3-phosphate dehydrogenase
MDNPHAVRDLLLSQIRMLHGEVHEGTKVVRIGRVAENFLAYTEDGRAIPGKRVVNTLGPWVRSVEAPDEFAHFTPQWCKAFNIVVSKQIDPQYAIGIEGHDKRLFFAVPRAQGTAIGTWYSAVRAVDEGTSVSPNEVHAFLASFNQAFQTSLTSEDVSSVDVGVLPMVRDSERGPVLYGSEQFYQKSGYVEVLSTKYTTFRSQGMAVLRALKETRQNRS